MRLFSYGILLLGLFPALSYSQEIVTERIFPVRGYSLDDVGYPFGVVPTQNEKEFALLEYWEPNDEHPVAHFYLQHQELSGFGETSSRSLARDGDAPMRVLSTHTLKSGHLVTARQYLPAEKSVQTVGRLYDTEGDWRNVEPIRLSRHGKRLAKNYTEKIRVSPEKRAFLWLGTDNKNAWVAAFTSAGREIWGGELNFPVDDRRYELVDAVVGEAGETYFLLKNGKAEYTWKDTLYPPLILRYDPRTQSYAHDTLRFDSAFAYRHTLALLPDGSVVVASLVGQLNPADLLNGPRADLDPQYWHGVHLHRGSFEPEWTLHYDSLSLLPASLREVYVENGAAFTQGSLQLSPDGSRAVWVWEEAYTTSNRIAFYDLAVLGLNLTTGNLDWVERIEKRQRTRTEVSFFSYLPAWTDRNFYVLFLTEFGAPGQLRAVRMQQRDGRQTVVDFASNENGTYFIFPANSGQVNEKSVVLVGMGNPQQNDYKLIRVDLE